MLLEKWSLDVNEKLLFSKSEELGMQVHLTSSFLNFHSNPLIQHQFSTDITNIKSNIKYELKTFNKKNSKGYADYGKEILTNLQYEAHNHQNRGQLEKQASICT